MNGVLYQASGTLTLTPPAPARASIVDLLNAFGLETDQLTSGALFAVRGSGFGASGTLTVAGVPVTLAQWSDTRVTFTAPATTTVKNGRLVVVPSGGQAVQSSFGVTLSPSPSVPAIPTPSGIVDPAGAPVHQAKAGTGLRVLGAGFGTAAGQVWFDPAGAAKITRWTDTEVDFVVPASPWTAPLLVLLYRRGQPLPVLLDTGFLIQA